MTGFESGYQDVPYPMTNGMHIAYFLFGFPTCGLAWFAWVVHAVAISGRTRRVYAQSWTNGQR